MQRPKMPSRADSTACGSFGNVCMCVCVWALWLFRFSMCFYFIIYSIFSSCGSSAARNLTPAHTLHFVKGTKVVACGKARHAQRVRMRPGNVTAKYWQLCPTARNSASNSCDIRRGGNSSQATAHTLDGQTAQSIDRRRAFVWRADRTATCGHVNRTASANNVACNKLCYICHRHSQVHTYTYTYV